MVCDQLLRWQCLGCFDLYVGPPVKLWITFMSVSKFVETFCNWVVLQHTQFLVNWLMIRVQSAKFQYSMVQWLLFLLTSLHRPKKVLIKNWASLHSVHLISKCHLPTAHGSLPYCCQQSCCEERCYWEWLPSGDQHWTAWVPISLSCSSACDGGPTTHMATRMSWVS